VIYCGAVAAGGEAFDQALARYKAPDTLTKDKGLLLNALACSKDDATLLQ
jgi:hypothetical protein